MSGQTGFAACPDPAAFFLTKKAVPVSLPGLPEGSVRRGPYCDTHTHLTSLRSLQPAQALARAALAGVDLLVTVTDPTEDAADPEALLSDLARWQEEAAGILCSWDLDQACTLPVVRLTVGCHPHNARLFDKAARAAMLRLLEEPICCGIGEIGLDYHYDNSPRDVQIQVFEEQLALACQVDAPLTLHVRDAHTEAERSMRSCGIPAAGAVMHCFDRDLGCLETFQAMGCHVGIGGAVTFMSSEPLRLALSSSQCKSGQIVTETDAPYMSPVPLRGTACEPACVALTCDCLAKLLADKQGIDPVAFLDSLHSQAHRLFNSHDGFTVPAWFAASAES